MINNIDGINQIPVMRTLISILCMFGLRGCVHSQSYDSDPGIEEFIYEKHEIDTGYAKHQTVLTGFLLGNTIAELAVVYIDEKGDHRLRIFTFENDTWMSLPDALLRPEVLSVDIANIGGHERLITCEPGRLNWFDPETATERKLLEFTTHINPSPDNQIPQVDITRDLNDDNRDDIVLPDTDGFWVYIQKNDGSFDDPIKLGSSEPFLNDVAYDDTRNYGEVGITAQTIPWYLSRVHQMDYNQDGRTDLAFWNQDHFDIHHQDERGKFDLAAKTFTVDIPFDFDGTYSLNFAFSGESGFALFTGFRKNTQRTVLHSFCDMNGDDVADLVTQSLEGRSLLRLRSRYDVYFGTPEPDGILFSRDNRMTLKPHGRAAGRGPLGYSLGWWQDFDGDGQADFIFGRVDTGIGGFFRATLANSIAIHLEYYRIEDGVFPNRPNGSLHIRPDLDFFGKRGPFFPVVLLGDVNGDGRTDLLAGQSRNELNVFPGVPGPELFARYPQQVQVAMSDNENYTWLKDLNRDGKQDIVLYNPSCDKTHRVMMLIAN